MHHHLSSPSLPSIPSDNPLPGFSPWMWIPENQNPPMPISSPPPSQLVTTRLPSPAPTTTITRVTTWVQEFGLPGFLVTSRQSCLNCTTRTQSPFERFRSCDLYCKGKPGVLVVQRTANEMLYGPASMELDIRGLRATTRRVCSMFVVYFYFFFIFSWFPSTLRTMCDLSVGMETTFLGFRASQKKIQKKMKNL